jgi:hypothetical protein
MNFADIGRRKFLRALTFVSFTALLGTEPVRSATRPKLQIVKDELLEIGESKVVKGSIYNPNARAVANVVINYRIWGKYQGQDGHGSIVKGNGGLLTDTIKYIPPKATVDFVARGDIPMYVNESPDPIQAEITADWAP